MRVCWCAGEICDVPLMLYVPLLNPCLDCEKLCIAVDLMKGTFLSSLAQKGEVYLWVISVARTHNKLRDRSFSAAGPRLWNDLPPGLRRPGLSFDSFGRSLKLEFGRCTHRTSKIGDIGACWNIGESASASR